MDSEIKKKKVRVQTGL